MSFSCAVLIPKGSLHSRSPRSRPRLFPSRSISLRSSAWVGSRTCAAAGRQGRVKILSTALCHTDYYTWSDKVSQHREGLPPLSLPSSPGGGAAAAQKQMFCPIPSLMSSLLEKKRPSEVVYRGQDLVSSAPLPQINSAAAPIGQPLAVALVPCRPVLRHDCDSKTSATSPSSSQPTHRSAANLNTGSALSLKRCRR